MKQLISDKEAYKINMRSLKSYKKSWKEFLQTEPHGSER